MSIDKAIDIMDHYKEYGVFSQANGRNKAIETMRKYQVMQADYEARLKADMVAMLTEIQLEIEELEKPHCHNASHADGCVSKWRVEGVIQQKINSLKAESEEE